MPYEEQPEGFRYRADPGPPLRYIRGRAMDPEENDQALWMIAWALLEVRDALRGLQNVTSKVG